MPAHEPFLDITRAAYETVAEDYAVLLENELERKPWDRAILATFAELVRAAGGGPVLDVGCGPGRITAHLHMLGLDVEGMDLSPRMVNVARRAHPHVTFEVGSMTALKESASSLAGLVAWYSIIHVPPERHVPLFREFRRVLTPGGRLLLAFQVGDERAHLQHAYGHPIELDAYRLPPPLVVNQLQEAGLTVDATLVRDPDPSEKTPQAFLSASPTA
ncbi:MAG TPA: methyltransferase domain-containing protein [Mycobacteriales bacterium]